MPTPHNNHQCYSHPSDGRRSDQRSDRQPNRKDGSSGDNPNDEKRDDNDEKKQNKSMRNEAEDIPCFPYTQKFTVCT